MGVVLLASCLGESNQMSEGRCGGPTSGRCAERAERVLLGPGTFPLGTGYPRVFDVPAGGKVRVRLVTNLALVIPGRSELARHGLALPTRFDLHGHRHVAPREASTLEPRWIVIEDVATGSELVIDTLRAKEVARTVIRGRTILLDYDRAQGARLLRLGNLHVDRARFDASTRFPTDRSWPVPAGEDELARRPVDALFDEILSSIRKAPTAS